MKYRKVVAFRHECYVAGIGAANYRNAKGGRGEGNPPFHPFDFFACEELTEEERKQEELEQNAQALRSMIKNKVVKEK